MTDLDPQKIISNPLAAGVAGALVGLRFAPGLSWLERITNVSTGAACASFVAPAAGELFRLSSASMMSGLAFAVGMFGMSLGAAIIQGLRDLKVGDIITSWISKR